MNKELSSQVQLYEDVGAIFKTPGTGQQLLSALINSIEKFSRARQVQTTCDFVVLSWGSGALGDLGAREFCNLTVQTDASPERLTIHDVSQVESTRQKIEAYNLALRENSLFSLSDIHQRIVDAPFWVLGYPILKARKAEIRDTELHLNKGNKTDELYGDEHHDSLYQLLEKKLEKEADGTEEPGTDRTAFKSYVDRQYGFFRTILIQRYFDGNRQDHQHIYYVPKYSQVRGDKVEFACQAVFGFSQVTESTYRYMQKAVNLFMDLLLVYQWELVNLESTARGVATSVENKGFSHNLNYIVHAPDFEPVRQETGNTTLSHDQLQLQIETQHKAMKYFAARQAFIASRAWGRRLQMNILPLAELSSLLYEDKQIYTTLLRVSIPADVDIYTDGIDQGYVMLPGGRAALNALRNILENIIRNVAKHSVSDIRERIRRDRVVQLRVSIEEEQEIIGLCFSLNGYDGKSFEEIASRLTHDCLYLIDNTQPNNSNRGMLEMLLSGMTLRGLPAESLRDRNRIECTLVDGKEVLISVRDAPNDGKRIKIFKFAKGSSDDTLVHTFYLNRAIPILHVVADRGKASICNPLEVRTVSIVSLNSDVYRGETFILAERDVQSHPAYLSFLHSLCDPRVEDPINTANLAESDSGLLEELWKSRLSDSKRFSWRGDDELHCILVLGMKSNVFEVGGLVRIVMVPSMRAKYNEIGSGMEIAAMHNCLAVLVHGGPMPEFCRNKPGGRYSGPLVEGYKDSNPIRGVIEYAEHGYSSASDRNQLWEYLDAAASRILVIDERLPKICSRLRSDLRPNCEGLSGISFGESWELQKVYLTVSIDNLPEFTEEIWDSFDFILAHDGWLRSELGGDAAKSLLKLDKTKLKARLLVHSDGGTFRAAKDDELFCHRWTDLLDVIEVGTKAQLLQLIRKTKRYSEHLKDQELEI